MAILILTICDYTFSVQSGVGKRGKDDDSDDEESSKKKLKVCQSTVKRGQTNDSDDNSDEPPEKRLRITQ